MDISTTNYLTDDSDYYCYHLNIQPNAIIANYQDENLIIQDVQEMPPTNSAALQLICIANERKIPIQVTPNNWKNSFIVEDIYILLFIKTIEKAYPLLASYLRVVCSVLPQ